MHCMFEKDFNRKENKSECRKTSCVLNKKLYIRVYINNLPEYLNDFKYKKWTLLVFMNVIVI